MDFVIGLLKILYKRKIVDVILIIVDKFIKLVRIYLIEIIINIIELFQLFYKKETFFKPFKNIVFNREPIFIS
jgi:hypothetical protein